MTYNKVQFEKNKMKTRNAIALRGRKSGYHSKKNKEPNFYQDYIEEIEELHQELAEFERARD